MPSRKRSARRLAADLLRSKRDYIEMLRMHGFRDDVSAHDDELDERLCAEFSADVERMTAELSERYGEPLRTGRASNRLVPVNGVVRYAVWEVGGRRLFVAAAREERECPFEVVLGVTAAGGYKGGASA